MAKQPLLAFFLLAYGVAWALWVPALLSDYGTGLLHINPLITIPLLLAGIILGPGFAGWYLTGASKGRRAARAGGYSAAAGEPVRSG